MRDMVAWPKYLYVGAAARIADIFLLLDDLLHAQRAALIERHGLQRCAQYVR